MVFDRAVIDLSATNYISDLKSLMLNGCSDPVRDAATGILPEKCAARQVAVTRIDDIFAPALLDEVRASWVATLGPFVKVLPEVEAVLNETREQLEALLHF